MNPVFESEFQITERELRLRELARQYDERCETFDQMVCSGRMQDGTAIPITRHQRSVVAFNARQLEKEIFGKTDYTRKEINRALRDL